MKKENFKNLQKLFKNWNILSKYKDANEFLAIVNIDNDPKVLERKRGKSDLQETKKQSLKIIKHFQKVVELIEKG